jgi:hypothetical protein
VCGYLWHGQFLSRGCTCEAMAELFGVRVSPGAAAGMATRVAGALSASLEAIRAAITFYLATAVKHGIGMLDALTRAASGAAWIPGAA